MQNQNGIAPSRSLNQISFGYLQVNELNPIIYQILHKETMEEETEHGYMYVHIKIQVFIFSERAKNIFGMSKSCGNILKHVQR